MNMTTGILNLPFTLLLGLFGTVPDLDPVTDAASILAAGAVLSSLVWGISIVLQARIKYRK